MKPDGLLATDDALDAVQGLSDAHVEAFLGDLRDAGYAERTLQTGLNRLQPQLEQLKTQASADAAKAPGDQTAPLVLEPGDLPPANSPPRSSAAAPPAKAKSRKPSKDPHGGVDGAGF